MPFIPDAVVASPTILTVVTTPITALITDSYIRVDATIGDMIVNLPAAVSGSIGSSIEVKKIDITVNTVTVNANGTDTVDLQSGVIITQPQDAYKLFISATGKWEII